MDHSAFDSYAFLVEADEKSLIYSKNYPNIRVFFPYWLCRRITQQGREELMYRYKSYKITRQEISDRIRGNNDDGQALDVERFRVN